MNFWDLAGDDGETDLQSLVESESPDISAILGSSELITAFRIREEYLINFLTDDVNIQKLLDVIFVDDDRKKAKIAMQLFIGSESPVLKSFVENGNLVDKTISAIDNYKYLQMGFLSQLYSCAFSRYPEIMAQHFSNLWTIIKKLITKIDVRSITDLLRVYLDALPENKRWLPWVFLGILLPSEPNTVPEMFSSDEGQIRELIHEARSISFTKKQFSIMLGFIKDFISCNIDNEFIVSLISKYVDSLPMGATRLEIALMVPKNAILYARAVKVAGSQTVTPHSVEALKYVTKYSSEDTIQAFPTLLANLTTNITNSFYFAEFVKLVEKLIKLNSFKPYIQSIMTAILNNATEDKWRKNVAFVGFYLELANIINPYCSSPEWEKFKNNEMRKWASKDEVQESNTEIDITSFSVDAETDGEIVGADAPKEVEDVFDGADFSQTFKKGDFAAAFKAAGEFDISDPEDHQNQESKSSSFFDSVDNGSVSFPSPEKKKGNDSFDPDFSSSFTAKENNFTPEFPTLSPTSEKKESNDNFGGFFDNIEDEEKPTFPTEKKDNIGGFFDNIEVDKKEEFKPEFPVSFPTAEKKETEDNIGGFFDDVNEEKEDFKPAFPETFPTTDKKETEENIGGFFDDIKDEGEKEEFKPTFPTEFGNTEKKETEDNIGGFFDDIKDEGEKDEFKPSFPDTFAITDKKETDNIGGFFDNIEDEKKDNIGGFFNDVNEDKKGEEFQPEFPASFPTIEKKKEEESNIGGFFNGVDSDEEEKAKDFEPQFPTNFPTIEKKEETDNIGGFFDNIDEKEDFKPAFPDTFPTTEKKETEDNIGGFFDNIGDDNEKKEEFKPEFPTLSPTTEKKESEENNIGGFFDEVDDNDNEKKEEFKPEFPVSFPTTEKKETEDNIGGFFDDVDEEKEDFKPAFPETFPTTEKKETEDNIGGFFDNIGDDNEKKEEFKPEFPTEFGITEKKETEENIGGFFNDIKDEGEKEEFKPAFPTEFGNTEKKETEDNIGGFFDDVDEEKDNNDNFKPNFPVSFPTAEEKDPLQNDNVGGFFDNIEDEAEVKEKKVEFQPEFPVSFPTTETKDNADETETTVGISGLSAIDPGFGAASDFTESIDVSQINASAINEPGDEVQPSQLTFPDVFPIRHEPTPITDGFGSVEFTAEVNSEDDTSVSEVSALSFAGGLGDIEFPADFSDATAFGNDLSVSVTNILKYLDDPNWTSTAPNPREFFAATDRFATEEDAFAFLTK